MHYTFARSDDYLAELTDKIDSFEQNNTYSSDSNIIRFHPNKGEEYRRWGA